MVASLFAVRFFTENPPSIQGAVITRDPNPAKELPIADVEVTMVGDLPPRTVHSDASGYFRIPLPRRVRPGSTVTLRFRHTDYQALDLPDIAADKLCIAQMTPRATRQNQPSGAEMTIAHVVAEYSITTTTTVNIGSAVKTFQVINAANLPCATRRPCSPDGKWKATVGSEAIDAGAGNQFHNARVSCVAGPCPFTRIEDTRLSGEDRVLRVSALSWSGTATFLLEAEVYKPIRSNVLRRSYPLIFDRALTFTLPAAAEGLSMQAEVNGTTIVFPLGPALFLSWAKCQVVVNRDQTKAYRCELKPGYRFEEGQAPEAGK